MLHFVKYNNSNMYYNKLYNIISQTTKAFLPAMIEKDHGHIVSMASITGLAGVNGVADYCTSKFAAVGKLL